MNALLDAHNVAFGYTQKPLFRGISLSLKAGQCVHLTGPNGRGKTTFLTVLAGLRQASSGKVTRHARVDLLSAEANAHYPKLSADANLTFWRNLIGVNVDDAYVGQVLKAWRLDHPAVRSHLRVEQFSTGMKRKLALARLCIVGAPVWLLDEPFLGLDDEAQGQLVIALKNHTESGGCALIVSHDRKPLESLSPLAFDLDIEGRS